MMKVIQLTASSRSHPSKSNPIRSQLCSRAGNQRTNKTRSRRTTANAVNRICQKRTSAKFMQQGSSYANDFGRLGNESGYLFLMIPEFSFVVSNQSLSSKQP